jgi:fatty-acyl-CoA synthase
MDGRAGMAAIVLENPSAFDGKQFYELVAKSLPAYAAPAFLRIQEEPEMTGTFKLRKVDLQKEGYDADVVRDPILVREDSAKAYVPLDTERRAALASGTLRI